MTKYGLGGGEGGLQVRQNLQSWALGKREVLHVRAVLLLVHGLHSVHHAKPNRRNVDTFCAHLLFSTSVFARGFLFGRTGVSEGNFTSFAPLVSVSLAPVRPSAPLRLR